MDSVSENHSTTAVVSTASITPTTMTVPSVVSVTVSSSSRPIMSTFAAVESPKPKISPKPRISPESIVQTQMKIKVSPSSESKSEPKRIQLTDLQNEVTTNKNNSHWLFEKVMDIEKSFNKRLLLLQGQIDFLESRLFVQDKVSEALRNEIDRLQQFTRRPWHCHPWNRQEKRREP